MARPQKFCIFCGRPGMSKEHVFSDWINDVLPPDGTHNRIRIRGFDAGGGINNPFHDASTHRQGGPATLTARVVCEECNSGWMSKLQDRAKPVLIPLINGKSASIGREAQGVLASWATMLSMTTEYLTSVPRQAIPLVHRQHL